MHEPTDSELLHDYVESGSESAFGTVVRRHIDFVYSAAQRMVVDPHLAEDVTQAVFMTLAKNARALSGRPLITGWLHRTAQNLAAKTVRTEMRRRAREQDAVATQTSDSEPVWKTIAPVLDTALGQLGEADRDVVLLRFFERKTTAEIAQQLRLSEETAQKRVTRALEKLRLLLSRQGVCLSATGLAAALGTGVVVAAPAPLFSAVTAAAVASAPAAGGIAFAMLKLITMTKIKAGAASALIVIGVATPLIVQHNALNRARDENRALQAQIEQVAILHGQTAALSNQLVQVQDVASLSKAQLSELMRLRSEVGLLRRESRELAKLRADKAGAASPPASADGIQPFVPAAAWANVGAEKPEDSLQTLLWASKHEATNLVAELLRVQRDPDIPESDEFDQMFAKTVVRATSWFGGSLQGFRVLTQDQDAPNTMRMGIELMDKKGKTSTHTLRFVREAEQWFPVMHLWLQDQGSIQAALEMPKKFKAQ